MPKGDPPGKRPSRPLGKPSGGTLGPAGTAALALAMMGAAAGSFLVFEQLPAQRPAAGLREESGEAQAVFLVRSTLMALNDANRSGNYSVLRDLAGPRFQQANPEPRLREVFRGYRAANADLSRAAFARPELTTAAIREDGVLVLDGSLGMGIEAAGGARLVFRMEFEDIDGHWRLLTLGVSVAA